MNRIILIGNGFDLAHGMKTTYQNFLDDYWENCINKIKNTSPNQTFENEEIKIENCPSNFIQGNKYPELFNSLHKFGTKINFKNIFLQKITEKSNIDSWVDVENEYYELLKLTFSDHPKKIKNYSIFNLNKDFEKIKNLLKTYLKEVNDKFRKSFNDDRLTNIIGRKIYYPFKLKDFSEDALNDKVDYEYQKIKSDIDKIRNNEINIAKAKAESQRLIDKIIKSQNPKENLRDLLQSELATNYFDLTPEHTLLLNFNYTFTELSYDRPASFDTFSEDRYTSVKTNHIHGTVDNYDKNPIIFGFGDELDDDYSEIEKLNDNKYLENIKSINYLETDNYKTLLEFINSDRFQILIFGHSCGISDRTLLNTMFEHENCSSIKVYYHLKDEGIDNYSDIIRNISRHFNDKAKMRDRVVNKKYCDSLS